MWLLWFFLFSQSVYISEATFGTPNLNGPLCHKWNCVNTKLGLPRLLPPREQYDAVLKSLLPPEWHQAAEKALDVCYGNRTKVYINSCAGQALMYCAVDNLIQNCPEEHWRKDDGCYSVRSIAGWNHMFSQSRFSNLGKSIPEERRPNWLKKQYFSSKCCDIPDLLNSSLLTECGFRTFLKYYEQDADSQTSLKNLTETQTSNIDTSEVSEDPSNDEFDPLSCCDMKAFINPSWRSECGFRLSWDGGNRLKIEEEMATATMVPETTTVATTMKRDVKVVPLSCETETCIFKKLNVISESGVLDLEAYIKFLDNFTAAHLSWTKAKARVITQCLSRNSQGYEAECEINRLLSCTFDVLTENCPNKVKGDICRSSRRNHTICQISSSKYRPKYRRSICGLPSMVDTAIVTQCGASGISTMEFVSEPVKYEGSSKKSRFGWHSTYSCLDSSPSTLCLMRKMGVLNRYNFLDYFKMKSSIRALTSSNDDWYPLSTIYLNVLNEAPMYYQHCSSPKKLLNVIDTMLTTCPKNKWKNTTRCDDFFHAVISTPLTGLQDLTEEQIIALLDLVMNPPTTVKPARPKKHRKYTEKKPIYDFGLLGSKGAPEARIIDVKNPPKAPLVILPVYLRTTSNPNKEQISITRTPLLEKEKEPQTTKRSVNPDFDPSQFSFFPPP